MATHTTEVEQAAATESRRFDELGLSAEALSAVRDAGYLNPTPIQAQAIPLILKGRDVMGLAQTGTGKTAAFTLPIVDRLLEGPRRTRALVLTPTRELCVQVEESVRKYARHAELGAATVYGGVPIEPQQKKLRAGVDIVVATPGRLIDHLERQNVVFDDLEVLVLDEADRMLDMGFAPQINRIVDQIPELSADAVVQRDDAAGSRGAGAKVSAQAGRRAGRAPIAGGEHGVARRVSGAARAKERAARDVCFARTGSTRCSSSRARSTAPIASCGISSATASSPPRCTPTRRSRNARGRSRTSGADACACSSRRTSRSAVSTSPASRTSSTTTCRSRPRTTSTASAARAARRRKATRSRSCRPTRSRWCDSIERVIGQPIPRISVPGFDFGTEAAD